MAEQLHLSQLPQNQIFVHHLMFISNIFTDCLFQQVIMDLFNKQFEHSIMTFILFLFQN
jgi:hypothetical protein